MQPRRQDQEVGLRQKTPFFDFFWAGCEMVKIKKQVPGKEKQDFRMFLFDFLKTKSWI
jgi:hypothetical protein